MAQEQLSGKKQLGSKKKQTNGKKQLGGKREESTYIIDAESAEEMARLIRQDQQLNQHMGGLFPEQLDLSHVQLLLDVACGPGGWALEMAFHHTDIQVVGIDISERMIAYANTQARVRQCENATFQVMNVLKPLAFEDASFDLVNARFISPFMPTNMWSVLFAECLRILRPGGIVRLTELDWGLSNKPAFERSCHLFHRAMSQTGHNFSPNHLHHGIIHMLPRFFRQAGLQRIGKMAHAVDFSAGTEARDGYHDDLTIAFRAIEPLIVKTGNLTATEWRDLSQQALAEMHEEDFCTLYILLTMWGYKPE